MKRKLGLIGLVLASTLTVGILSSCGGDDNNNNESEVSKNNTVEIGDGKNIYVANNGDYSLTGESKDAPTTFEKAIRIANPGDTILMAGGVYSYASRINVGERQSMLHLETGEIVQGTYDNYITVMPEDKNERVIFDFSQQIMNDGNRGIQLYSDYWHFMDLEIRGAGDNGMYIAGSHNIIENCLFYGNKDTGLQLGRSYSDDSTIDMWPSCNVIKNCTSFANYDDGTFGENADGFAAKLTVGYGNVFDGCVAFRNSDDGWDMFAKVDSGDIGTVILTNCVSFENGFLPYLHEREDKKGIMTYDTLNGDGIGFKLGGSTMRGNVIVNNCAAFDNKLHGFGDNSNPGVLQVTNITAFNNCAGINEDGTISKTRGLDGIQNKSNNIDLARSIESYNSYSGVLSYINNQKEFKTINDSSYNKDAFRGSTSYSIFNTGYSTGELYKAFTTWEDASSYRTATEDLAFSSGVEYQSLTDDMFYELDSINMCCENEELDTLAGVVRKFDEDYRNKDNSVNLHNHLRVKEDSVLATYNNGNPVGAVLNKEKDSDYYHYDIAFASGKAEKGLTSEQEAVTGALSICEAITRNEATYQDFRLPKILHGCDITWESSNTDVVNIELSEEYSVSQSAFSWARISVPTQDTKVTLTATATCGKASESKQIEITVKPRKRTLGYLVSTSESAIRVNKYGSFIAPRIYATDESSITVSELPISLYDLKYTIKYATDGNSKYYTIAKNVDSVNDYVYTSVPGVYEITATATLKSDTQYVETLTYNVYVVDPDCDIDFKGDSTVVLSQSGFVVSGDLSNIEGDVAAIYSPTKLNITTGAQLLTAGGDDVQYSKISTDSIVASFTADNTTIVDGSTQYYLYYTVLNANRSNADKAKVYSEQIKVENISTKDEFFKLARTGTGPSGSTANNIIYSLTNDLDFTGYDWKVATTDKEFSGLFRGNGHTISNITVDKSADDKQAKTVNVFFKLSGGTIMDVNFSDISLTASTSTGKQVAIIGALQGGYVSNVHATRISMYGKEAIGGIIGQVTGQINYVDKCSLVNPIPEVTTDPNNIDAILVTKSMDAETLKETYSFDLDSFNAKNTYKIHAANKYAGGIIGNAQKDNDQSVFKLYVTNCYVSAAIGDGHDGAGNTGLLISRVKNDDPVYYTEITNNVVYGIVLAKGQYNSGIVGDFDNGSGNVAIRYNYAEVSFFYGVLYLDAYIARTSGGTSYAHKNSNPIVGRAVSNPIGTYTTSNNVGSWVEYYATYIHSKSLAFDLWDDETNTAFEITLGYAKGFLNLDADTKLDTDTIWKLVDGKLILKSLVK